MKIDYNMYYKNNFVIPSILLIALAVFLVVNIYGLVKNIEQSKPIHYSVFAIAVALLITIPMTVILSRGISLISEKESNTAVIEGEVTGIEWAHNSPRYYINGKACRGVWVYLDNEKYYMADTGELSVGERVELRYLERSRFVLEYVKEKCENETMVN